MAIYGESFSKFKSQEKVTNGGFDTDSDWTKGAGWTITGGKAVATNVVAFAALNPVVINIVVGVSYTLSFTVSDYSGGGRMKVWLGGHNVGQVTANGDYSYTAIPVSTSLTMFQGADTLICKVDNVSVVEVVNLNFSTIKPNWKIPQVIRHKSILTGVVNYVQVAGDKAVFDVVCNIWKNAVPKTTMQTILAHNHSTVKFMPHEDEGNYLTTDGTAEADFYISIMKPSGVKDKPPILQDKLFIRFESLGQIVMPLVTVGFLVDEGGDFLIDEEGDKLIKEIITGVDS